MHRLTVAPLHVHCAPVTLSQTREIYHAPLLSSVQQREIFYNTARGSCAWETGTDR